MLPFGVTIPATVPQRSEIVEGLMVYPVHFLGIIEVLCFIFDVFLFSVF